MDHIFVRNDTQKRVFTRGGTFNERVTFKGLEPMQPSDHLGVAA